MSNEELRKERLLWRLQFWQTLYKKTTSSTRRAIEENKQIYQQIKSLIENQPEVDEEFIKEWRERIYCGRKSMRAIRMNLEEMLIEAGVKVISGKEEK